MTQTINSLGQNLGAAVPDWQSARRPEARTLTGRFCRLEALSAERHADALFAEFSADSEGRNWTYLPYGPFASAAEFATWVGGVAAGSDPCGTGLTQQDTRRPSSRRISPSQCSRSPMAPM